MAAPLPEDLQRHDDDNDPGSEEHSEVLNTSLQNFGISTSLAINARTEAKKSVRNGRFSLNQPSSLSTKRKFILGLVIVCLIAVSWVGSTQTAKSSFTQTTDNATFAAPFFVMYFGTAWEMLIFPLTMPFFFLTGKHRLNTKGVRELWKHSVCVFSRHGITFPSLLTSSVLFGTIWAATNYMYARALTSIAATDVTALFSSAPAFVFLFSICVLGEPPLILRFIAVIMAIAGIVLFAYVDGFEIASIVGVVLSVGSAVGAALYKVLLKWRVGDASFYQMALFLSMLGLFVTLAFWPILVLLHYLGAEKVENVPWGYICASSALGLLFNFSINFGIAYTFPLFISLGTILGIPLNAVIDAVFRRVHFFNNWKFTATDLIVGGFMLMLIPPSDSQWIHRQFLKLVTCGRHYKYREVSSSDTEIPHEDDT